MVFASVGHWYAFSHKDYTELDILSARMPIYHAVRDASGFKDIVQDSLETLKGTRFTYRTFEPSEGVATDGMSRSGRIMAGLRYSGGGTSKYWLPDANKIAREALMSNSNASATGVPMGSGGATSAHYNRPEHARNPNSYSQQALGSSYTERAPSLYFRDVDEDEDDGMEELYDASKQLEFGDYNYPAIDVLDPKRSRDSDRRKMARKNKRQAKRLGERSALLGGGVSGGGVGHGNGEEARPLMSESGPTGSTFGKSGWSAAATSGEDQSSSRNKELKGGEGGKTTAPRDGCVDNVNGFVSDGKKKKKKVSYPTTATATATAPSGSASSRAANYNGAYDTFGYGYQSYQQPDNSSHYLGQQQQQQKPLEDDEDNRNRGPMFFFL
ncbi:hypothetical protein EDD21DRAFT_69437 [Dissophora ornata]|nr:hypothetical protein EDD21DRAFT_69437 [Dissophora ornata]